MTNNIRKIFGRKIILKYNDQDVFKIIELGYR